MCRMRARFGPMCLVLLFSANQCLVGQTKFFDYSRYLFGTSSTLSLNVESVNTATGTVTVNGSDTQGPTTPFTWNWGDGQVSSGFFPQSHTFSNATKNYLLKVISNYSGGKTDSCTILVRFVSPSTSPITLSPDIAVTIPSSPTALGTRLYTPPTVTAFNESFFTTTPRSVLEYVLSVVSSIEKDFVNDDVFLYDSKFAQVMLRDSSFGGAYSLWYTNPVAFGVGDVFLQGSIGYSALFHEMGHNYTLNSPGAYYFGGRIDGNANAIFSESTARIFQQAAGYEIVNNYQHYGLSEDLMWDIQSSVISSMQGIRASFDDYVNGGKKFCSWNDPNTSVDETFNTFVTIAYKFCEQAENTGQGYRIPAKRMMKLLQCFNSSWSQRYDQSHNTAAADTFRATLMATAVSYGFGKDLRADFRNLNFPISDQTYTELYNAATATAGAATTIALASGNGQAAVVSTALANPFVVTVTDAGGNPVSGATVNFAVASTPTGATGQSLSTAIATTNISGQASTVLTLGNKAGPYSVTATSSGLSGSPVTLTATATAGAPKTLALATGNSQSAAVSAVLSNSFVVTVTDVGGNPVSGVTVSFAIASTPTGATGQSLSIATTTTNISGQASSVLTLGNKVGTYSVTAASSGLSGSPVTFTATATSGAATTIALVSGNGQAAVIGVALSNPFVVTVKDAGGNLVSGVNVSFAISSMPTGATGQALSTATTLTSSSGQASSVLTLGNKVGTYTVTAASSGLSGSPVTFAATATAGAATTMALASGNSQTAAISTALPNPFVVTLTDAGGNAVVGVSVNFAFASTPTGATGQSLSTTTTTTNISGQASSILTLGNKAGMYTVTSASNGLSGSPVTFSATATNPAPTLSSISIKLAGRGSKINVTLTGTNFLDGITTASFGADVTVNSQTVISSTQIGVNVSISPTASLGTRDVTVTNTGPGGGTATLSSMFTIDASVATRVEDRLGATAGGFVLCDAYPNPFNPSCTIRYAVPERSRVRIGVYNALGELVIELLSGEREEGYYEVQWSAQDAASGVYFVRMQAKSPQGGKLFVSSKKVVLMR